MENSNRIDNTKQIRGAAFMAKKRKAITEDGRLVDAGEEPAEAQEDARPIEVAPEAEQRVERENKFRVSQDDIDRCITQHEEVLCNAIRGAAPPADANILTLLQTIEALKALKPTVH